MLDWDVIHKEYHANVLTLLEIARKHKVSTQAIYKHARKNNWPRKVVGRPLKDDEDLRVNITFRIPEWKQRLVYEHKPVGQWIESLIDKELQLDEIKEKTLTEDELDKFRYMPWGVKKK